MRPASASRVRSKSVRGIAPGRATWRRRRGSAQRWRRRLPRRPPRRAPRGTGPRSRPPPPRCLPSPSLIEAADVVLVARALQHRAVEGEREVRNEVTAKSRSRPVHVVAHGRGHGRHHVEPVERPAGAFAPLAHLGHHHALDVVRVAEPEDHPVGDLAGQAQHPGGEGRDVDREVGPRLKAGEAKLRGPALAPGRILAPEHRADCAHVLAHLAHGLADLLAVPALHHRPVGDPQAEHHPAAGELVHRGGDLRGGHRRPRVDRHHPGADLDPLGAAP